MPKNASPLAARIARTLARRIAEGLHTVPLALRQSEIAAEFGASHIPVREALALLSQMGLVRIEPNRGAQVVPLSAGQCIELAEIRAELEALAVRHAVPRSTSRDLVRAGHAHAVGCSATTLAARARANWAFHRRLYLPAQRPFLIAQIEALWRHSDRYLMFAWSRVRYERRSDEEHAAILSAYAQHDARRAAALVRRHVLAAAEATAAMLGR